MAGTGFTPSGARPALCNVTAGDRLEGFVVGFLPPRQATVDEGGRATLPCQFLSYPIVILHTNEIGVRFKDSAALV